MDKPIVVRQTPAKMLGNPSKMSMCHNILMTDGSSAAQQMLGNQIGRLVPSGGRGKTAEALLSPLDCRTMEQDGVIVRVSRLRDLSFPLIYTGAAVVPFYLSIRGRVAVSVMNGIITYDTARRLLEDVWHTVIPDTFLSSDSDEMRCISSAAPGHSMVQIAGQFADTALLPGLTINESGRIADLVDIEEDLIAINNLVLRSDDMQMKRRLALHITSIERALAPGADIAVWGRINYAAAFDEELRERGFSYSFRFSGNTPTSSTDDEESGGNDEDSE